MTRINVVPVFELSDQHLMAEYRELPRVIKQKINTTDAPRLYKLGLGHVKWAGLIEFDLEQETIKNIYGYTNVHAVYIKKAPAFDKVQPTWGMIVSAYRNGMVAGSKATTTELYKEGIITFDELKEQDND